MRTPESTRARLTAYAIELFARDGYDAVTVEEITKVSGLTKGAFYYHFRSKEDCLTQIHVSFVSYAHSRFEQIMKSGGSAEHIVRSLMAELFSQIRDYRDQVIVLWDSRRSLPPAESAAVEARKDDIRHFFAETIARGQDEGVFHSSHDPRAASLALMGMCMWAYHWYQPGGPMTPDQLSDAFADIVMLGFRTASSG